MWGGLPPHRSLDSQLLQTWLGFSPFVRVIFLPQLRRTVFATATTKTLVPMVGSFDVHCNDGAPIARSIQSEAKKSTERSLGAESRIRTYVALSDDGFTDHCV